MTPAKAPPPGNQSIDDLLAELDAEFGKGKNKKDPEAARKERNKQFHANNPLVAKTSGKAPERLNPENSETWKPVARITHCVIQECASCGDCIEFIGGEFIRFRSIHRFGGEITRRAEMCPSLFLFDSIKEPLEELNEWHYQKVRRCTGCIRVEQQARELWEAHLEQERQEALQLPLVDITQPFPRRVGARDVDLDITFEETK